MQAQDGLERFFMPQTIAVVGASNQAGKMGQLFVQHLADGFPGTMFLVHPTERQIAARPVYPDITAVPEPIDLLIPLIPADQLLPLITRCRRGQVRFLLAIPSGFAEVSSAGEAQQQALTRCAHARGIRVIGPNSVGMLNCPYGLNASMLPERPLGGAGLSCVTQSGGFGMALYMYTRNHALPMAKFCDLGNTADVSLTEVLQYLQHDDETRMVGVFVESTPNWDAFIAQASAVAAVKPFLLTKLGRTSAGERASLAHLGIVEDTRMAWKKTPANAIIPASTGLEMLHIAKGLSRQPLPKGRRVGILTGSGGIGSELADLCLEHGLEVPVFSPHLQEALRPYLPAYASVQNPVDLTPIWPQYPQLYPPLIQTLCTSAEIDLLLVTVIDVATTLEALMVALAETVSPASGTNPITKPLYVYWASLHSALPHMRLLEAAGIPCYESTRDTVGVAAAIYRYAAQVTARGA